MHKPLLREENQLIE